jgi:hypothetical protein
MKIELETMLAKRDNCIKALDCSKCCDTCEFKALLQDQSPCNKCMNEMLGMPVNPTEWKQKLP